MPLTDVKIRAAKAADKPYKLNDTAGLHLYVAPSGLRSWRLRCKRSGREHLITLGSYPELSLKQAREARDDRLRDLRDHGVAAAVAAPSSSSLAEVALRWHEANKPRWKEHHAVDVMNRLQEEILPALGNRPARDVTGPELLSELRRVALRSVDIAHRLRGYMDHIFAFAIAEGATTVNPATMIAKAMPVRPEGNHRPGVTTLEAAREVLRKTESIPAYPLTRLALRFMALTAVRPGEASGTEWREIDGDTWLIPGQRMKMGRDHMVPLAQQALEVLEVAQTFSRRSDYVFPAVQSIRHPMAENSMNVMLRRAGLSGIHCPHGWRATFSSVMNERNRSDSEVIELMLAHAKGDKVKAAYDRAKHIERRRELAQDWAALLLEGMPPAKDLIEGPRHS